MEIVGLSEAAQIYEEVMRFTINFRKSHHQCVSFITEPVSNEQRETIRKIVESIDPDDYSSNVKFLNALHEAIEADLGISIKIITNNYHHIVTEVRNK